MAKPRAHQKTLQMLSVETLKPHPKNARVHSDEQIQMLSQSIQEFGFTAPVLVDKKHVILAGHGRVLAAKMLGMEEVPCRVLNVTQKQALAIIVADNQLNEQSEWDTGGLSQIMSELEGEDFSFEAIGFSDKELDELLPDVSAFEESGEEIKAVPIKTSRVPAKVQKTHFIVSLPITVDSAVGDAIVELVKKNQGRITYSTEKT